MLVVQHWIDQEILRNKYPAHCNHSSLIYVFQFDFECTTYVYLFPDYIYLFPDYIYLFPDYDIPFP